MSNIDYAWLQISDLHIYDNTEWIILQEAYKRLPYTKDIRFLVVTGDLHQYKDDYEKTKKFLNNLLNLFNLSKKDIFIVPGNHDSGPCDAKKAITHFIEDKVDEDQDCYREYFVKGKLVDCFENYNKFIKEFYGTVNHNLYQNPEQVSVITWNNKINIIHLNTAINCNGNNKLKQIVDIYQLSNIPENINKNCPTIMIAHHPFESIHVSHQDVLRRNITDWNVSAYLCGDLHKEVYTPIMTYSESGSNIPCIVCGKASPEYSDSYSDLGCVLYVKPKEDRMVQVLPFIWNDEKKTFETSTKFNNDQGNLKFEMLANDNVIEESVEKKRKMVNALVDGESIWLPDAEDAQGEQSRFCTFTETNIIHDFIRADSNFWGLYAVKGIGKTFVLQIKRSKIPRNKLCLPLGIKPSAKTDWGTDTIHIESKMDLSGLKEFENVVCMWKYGIVVYAINQLVNIKNKIKKEKVLGSPEERIRQRLEDALENGKISEETYVLCTDEDYRNLGLIIKGILGFKNWTNFVANDLGELTLFQRRIEEMLEILNKKSLVIMIDKVDQAIRQTNAEEPFPCEQCKKSKKINTCNNPLKSEDYCSSESTQCRVFCCYGCETFETPYSNTGLRLYDSQEKRYAHINLWQYIQMGLVKAVASIKEEYDGIIEVYFTIRQEAFSCESNLLGENVKKITRIINELWYTKEQQKEIFYDCIRYQQDEFLFEPELRGQQGKIEEAFVGVSQLCHPYAKDMTETIFESIYRHSFDRTRDIQEYGQLLTKKMDEIRQCDTKLARGEKVKEIIESKAAELAFNDKTGDGAKNTSYYVEKLNLLPNFWADSENFKKLLMMFDKNLLFGKEAKKVCRKFNNVTRCVKNCSECEAEHHPFSMLYKFGMLGQIKTYQEWKDSMIQEFVDSKDVTYIVGNQLINLNEDTIYMLHPALTKSIECLNKKVRHFSGFIIGKGLKVPQSKLATLQDDFRKLTKREYDNKYFYDKAK